MQISNSIKEKILTILIEIAGMSLEEAEATLPMIDLESFNKGHQVLNQGNPPEMNFYIFEGLVRQYMISESGKEITIDFFKEGQSVNMFSFCDEDGNSLYSLACLEDCVVTPCPHNPDESLDEEYPQISNLIRYFNNSRLTELQSKYASFKLQNPEERFLSFAKADPELMKRVSQHILSSYLDISPETFSRYKKRFLKNN
jgi:CRP-like cAMP-binding protein